MDESASRNPEEINEGTGSSSDPLPVSLLQMAIPDGTEPDATLPVTTAPPNAVRAPEGSPLKQIDSRKYVLGRMAGTHRWG